MGNITDNITVLDGGMGRELSRRGAPFQQPEWSALALWEAPEAVQAIHEDFIRAGAQVIITNNYAVVPFHIGEQRFATDGQRLAALSGEFAQAAVEATQNVFVGDGHGNTQIAGCLPPLFGSYQPDLFDANHAERLAKPLINGLSPFVDLWLLETQSAIIEAQSVIRLLPNDNKPIWVAFTVEDEKLADVPIIRSGESVADAVVDMLSQDVSGILFNCSQPEVMSGAIAVTKQILTERQANHVQIGCYANAFAPETNMGNANEQISTIRQDLTPEQYLGWAKQWQADGATLIGGCCGIGPEHIKALAENLL